MSALKKSVIFSLFLLAGFQPARAQSFSNSGKEFWIPFSYHRRMGESSVDTVKMTLYISSKQGATYSVQIFGGAFIQENRIIAPDQTVAVEIPVTCYLDNDGLFRNKILKVTASEPVAVYSYISWNSVSAATVCLPTNVLGKEYYSMNYNQRSNEGVKSNSYITIIAVDTGTTRVEITPSGATVGGWFPGQPYYRNLSQGEAYQVLGVTYSYDVIGGYYPGVDLTGTKVVSVATGSSACKRIAVFSGAGKNFIGNGCLPSNGNSSDNLYQQLYPYSTWGNNFLAVPSYNRNYNYYRIMAKDPATTVRINNNPGVTLPIRSGSVNYLDIGTNALLKIESENGPISVAQYFTTQTCNGNGAPYDPDMILLNPIEQNIKSVQFVNARLQKDERNFRHEHHIHVIMKNQGTALSSFEFDNQRVPTSLWKPHPQEPGYSYLYLDDFKTVTQGYHSISSDSGFNALAYGYAEAESYGYSAGSNVRDKYQYLSIQNDSATTKKLQTCNGRPFYMDITVPFEVTQLNWEFASNALPSGSISRPRATDTIIVDSKSLFTYKLPLPFIKATPGNYVLKLKMEISSSTGCSGSEESEYEFEVIERPKAGFSNMKNCVSDPIVFTDTSKGYGSFLINKYWDFGDLSSGSGSNVTHQYTAAGTYMVKQWVVNEIGCLSDTAVLAKVVDPLPQARMVFTDANCEKRILPVEDNSIPNTAKISTYKWSISPVGLSSNDTNPSFVLDMGTYDLQHIVVNDKGCTDTITQSVTVNEVPKTNFEAPKACLVDPAAPFTNLTPYITGFPFSYLWNFGDLGSATNTSTDENPSHKYNTKGDFRATLTVTSSSGCDSTKEIPFTINGVNPVARFDALSLCSNKEVILQNNSQVIDGGNVVKVEVFWDLLNDPLNDTIDNDPRPGSLYQHKYGLVTMPVPATTYNVRYIAYSGLTCRDILDTTVVVLASPLVQFDPLRSICQEKVDTLITVTETTAISGSGVFSGTGITTLTTTSAEFQPGSAGPGQHKISYTFTADNGCFDTASRIITVNPTPTNVSAGGDASGKVYVLEEDSVVLRGRASGAGLTYLWVPATGMNNNRIDTPKVSLSNDNTYTFTAFTDSGCRASAAVTVIVLKKLIVPNAFTPNGDMINDTWDINPLNIYPDAIVRVYTRYGQLVFESRGYGRPWDGTFNGKPLPIATYYWVIDPKKRKPINGTVSIIR